MPFIDAFLTDTVIVHSFKFEGDGEPVFDAPETRKARVELNPALANRVQGYTSIDEVPAKALMFCTGSPIPTRSRVEYEGAEYSVKQCSVCKGFSFSHLEVILE